MFPAYSTAKAGIHGLTRSLARDLGKHNIRINSIAPGSIATARQSKLWLNPKFKKEILKNQALKKQLLPEDISKMVLFLASDISSGCTKQNFTVDAGLILFFLFCDIDKAILKEFKIGSRLASFFPAIANADPWAVVVTGTVNPPWTVTPLSKPNALRPDCNASWYIPAIQSWFLFL